MSVRLLRLRGEVRYPLRSPCAVDFDAPPELLFRAARRPALGIAGSACRIDNDHEAWGRQGVIEGAARRSSQWRQGFHWLADDLREARCRCWRRCLHNLTSTNRSFADCNKLALEAESTATTPSAGLPLPITVRFYQIRECGGTWTYW
jgi:hypothetical protein